MGLDGEVEDAEGDGGDVDFCLGDLDEGLFGARGVVVDGGGGVEDEEARAVDVDAAVGEAFEGGGLVGQGGAEGGAGWVVGAGDKVLEGFFGLFGFGYQRSDQKCGVWVWVWGFFFLQNLDSGVYVEQQQKTFSGEMVWTETKGKRKKERKKKDMYVHRQRSAWHGGSALVPTDPALPQTRGLRRAPCCSQGCGRC